MKNKLSVPVLVAAFLSGYAMYGNAQSTGDSPAVPVRQMEARHRMESLRTIEARANGSGFSGERVRPLTPKEKKALEALKAPVPEDAALYSEFLKLEGTGIVRLFPGSVCDSKYIVRADANCTNLLPSIASHLFRKSGITADIVFRDGLLIADGFFANSIMTSLGNVPLDRVSLTTGGMQYLTDHVPAGEFDLVKQQYVEIVRGVTADGRLYTNRLAPVPETTYAVRIIAFRNGNNIPKRLRWYRANLPFWAYQGQSVWTQMDKDVRADITVGFRVIKKDEDGSITLVWKELARKESPKIVFPDGVALTDFKLRTRK
jgi:hypothetical protein